MSARARDGLISSDDYQMQVAYPLMSNLNHVNYEKVSLTKDVSGVLRSGCKVSQGDAATGILSVINCCFVG